MADRKVYIVRGSEDGNLGVFSNKKAAYKEAMEYLLEYEGHYLQRHKKQNDGSYEFWEVKASYTNFCETFKTSYNEVIYAKGTSTEVYIEEHILKSK